MKQSYYIEITLDFVFHLILILIHTARSVGAHTTDKHSSILKSLKIKNKFKKIYCQMVFDSSVEVYLASCQNCFQIFLDNFPVVFILNGTDDVTVIGA